MYIYIYRERERERDDPIKIIKPRQDTLRRQRRKSRKANKEA